jgi:CheY-like chemotaxis protein
MLSSQKVRVLTMDDDPLWRNLVQRALDPSIYIVESVSSTENALAKLEENFYHLLILDIRLKDDDESNIEGMTFLDTLTELGISPSTEIIMLSRFPQWMRVSFRDKSVADFIDKLQYNSDEFAKTVHDILFASNRTNRKFILNFNTKIIWQGHLNARQAVTDMKLGQQRLRSSDPRLDRIAEELEELLRRLFADAHSVLIRPIAAGYSGAGVVLARPFFKNNNGVDTPGQEVVVKYGDRHQINAEYVNYNDNIERFDVGYFSTSIRDYIETTHLAAIAYSFMGASNDPLADFGMIYRTRDIEFILKTIDNLFNKTCRVWYGTLGGIAPRNLTDAYALLDVPSKLPLIQQFILPYENEGGLVFPALPRESFPHPLTALSHEPYYCATYMCVTHGDMNDRNVLVDHNSQAWLIDFRHTGVGHIMRDLAELDVSIRIELLHDTSVTLEQRLQMERTLNKPRRFSDLASLPESCTSDPHSPLEKAYRAVLMLRRLAREKVHNNPLDDFAEYYIALYYLTLNSIRFNSLSTVQREHAIVSSALLAERLSEA